MLSIHPIQTGHVKIKQSQRNRKTGGLARVITASEWTEWLPIYAWAIKHPEGVIVVDTGETARANDLGYYPGWHPYYRTSLRMKVQPEDEIGPGLERLGIDPRDVKTVVLTHLHTDHAGGLHHFPESDIYVTETEYRQARGLTGRLRGYLPNRWPDWFSPHMIDFASVAVGPFDRSRAITRAGDVTIVPTPGHTAGHASVVVQTEQNTYFIAGDTSYTEHALLEGKPDGIGLSRGRILRTLDAIRAYARSESIVYLPSHDPGSPERLKYAMSADRKIAHRTRSLRRQPEAQPSSP